MSVASNGHQDQLMVSGFVEAPQGRDGLLEIRRSMSIKANEGQEVGRVAAIVVDCQSQKVSHIVLSRYVQALEYRLVPACLIEQVAKEVVVLGISSQLVESLPEYHGS